MSSLSLKNIKKCVINQYFCVLVDSSKENSGDTDKTSLPTTCFLPS